MYKYVFYSEEIVTNHKSKCDICGKNIKSDAKDVKKSDLCLCPECCDCFEAMPQVAYSIERFLLGNVV